MVNVVTVGNLGLTFLIGSPANKINVNIDGITLKANALGVISANPSGLLSADAGNVLHLGTDGKLYLAPIDVLSPAPDNQIVLNGGKLYVNTKSWQLPAPSVKIRTGSKQSISGSGLAYDGSSVDFSGECTVSYADIPQELFDPKYELRLEILRWIPKRNSKKLGVSKVKNSGWVHPNNTKASGVAIPVGGSGRRTRNGNGTPVPAGFDRITEFLISGSNSGGRMSLPYQSFSVYFKRGTVFDVTGGNFTRLVYYSHRYGVGKTGRGSNTLARHGYFRLRFTYWNGTEYISSPLSSVFRFGAIDPFYKTRLFGADQERWMLEALNFQGAKEVMTFSNAESNRFSRKS